MPLSAVDGVEQAGLANTEQGPGFVEAISQKPTPVEKKSILPYILVGVGVAAVAAILFLVVFKTKYDITGYWTGTESYEGSSSESHRYRFSGDNKSGTVEIIDPPTSSVVATGPYTVDGKRITWSIIDFSFPGAFDSPTAMKGDILFRGSKIGTFALIKTLSDAVDTIPQECDIIGSWIFEFNRRGSKEYYTIVFSGNKTNGEFMAKNSDWMAGTYTVVDTAVTMTTKDKPDVYFSGRFTAENTMTGSWSTMSEAWYWTAQRARIK
jgi:hypothetical protein